MAAQLVGEVERGGEKPGMMVRRRRGLESTGDWGIKTGGWELYYIWKG